MARRMYDLDSGTEDIKVKSIIDAYGHIVTIDDAGFSFFWNDVPILNVTVNVSTFKVPIRFSPYTTPLRPTDIPEGSVIYDSTLAKLILWNGTAWVNLDGTALS